MKLKLIGTIRAIKERPGGVVVTASVPGYINPQLVEINPPADSVRGLLPGDKILISIRSMSDAEQRKLAAAERAATADGPACND